MSFLSSIIVNLFKPDKTRFLAVSIPNAPNPYMITLAYDYLLTESKPITPIYLDIRF